MTEVQTLKWIKLNLSEIIDKALIDNVHYTQDWLAAMTMRETGILIMRHWDKPFSEVCKLMRGDYSKRNGDEQPMYHGFGFMQIDVDSYPEFVESGDWQDPYKTFRKAVSVLEEKRKYLITKLPTLIGEPLNRAVTASYNCGAGNVSKALKAGKSPDAYTYNHDYSKEVWRFREIYKSIQ